MHPRRSSRRRDRDPIDPDLAADDPAAPAPDRQARTTRTPRPVEPDVLMAIAVGGMLGAAARFRLAEALPSEPGQLPWATFWTNLSGSFVLGFGLILLVERFPPTRYVRPFFATGILGAYTTMSTFLVETAVLVKDGHVGTGVIYAVGSIVAGLSLTYAGISAGRLASARRRRDPERGSA